MVKELLKIACKREAELDKILVSTRSYNRWFFEETRLLNLKIQEICIDRLDKQERITTYVKRFH